MRKFTMSPSGVSAGNLFGTERIFQAPPSLKTAVVSGVKLSFPTQKGHLGSYAGTSTGAVLRLKSSGRFALSFAMIIQS